MKLQEYDLTAKHRKGTEQKNADFMSHLEKLIEEKFSLDRQSKDNMVSN